MSKEKKKEIEVDDKRQIANMNVEGLPWYRKEQDSDSKGEKLELMPKEYKYFIWGVLKAAFLITFIFAFVYFLFILFLDVIVFKN